MKKLMAAALLCASACAHADWTDTLQARDFDGNGTADAYFDTDLNITWLADANYGLTTRPSGAIPNGAMSQIFATSWAAGLDLGGVTGWRLPASDGIIHSDACISLLSTGWPFCAYKEPDPAASEMAHMFYSTLGNTSSLASTGPFINLAANEYWGSTTFSIEAPPGNVRGKVFNFVFNSGMTDVAQIGDGLAMAWLVHDGDVGTAISPIPEPSTYALMLAGLGAIGWAARRRRSA